MADKSQVLLEGSNGNYVTYKNMLFNGQRFSYNPLNKHLINTFSRKAMGVSKDVINKGGNIESWVDVPKNIGLQWDLVYTGGSETPSIKPAANPHSIKVTGS